MMQGAAGTFCGGGKTNLRVGLPLAARDRTKKVLKFFHEAQHIVAVGEGIGPSKRTRFKHRSSQWVRKEVCGCFAEKTDPKMPVFGGGIVCRESIRLK